MSKVAVIGAVVVIGVGAVGGGGYYYASQQAEKKFQEKIELIKSSFPGTTITYSDHHISVFSQEATMNKVVLKYKDRVVYTADKVDAVIGSDDEIKKLAIDKLAIKKENDTEILFTIGHIELANAKAGAGAIVIQDGKIEKIFPSKISFGLVDIQNFEFKDKYGPTSKIAQYTMKNYGLGKKTDIVLKDLSIKDRYKDFALASFKTDQIDLAEISKKQEEFFADENNHYRSADAAIIGVMQNLSTTQFGLLSVENLQLKDRYGPEIKMAQYQMKDYGLDKKTDILLKDLSIKDRKSGFSLGAFVIDQINLANIVKSQTKYSVGENNYRSTNDELKRVFNTLSIMQFNLFSIDNLQFSIYNSDFKIAQYQIKDYGVGRKTSQSLKDFSVIVPFFSKIAVSLASYESSGVDVATIMKVFGSYTFNLNHLDDFSNNIRDAQKEYLQKVGGIQSNGKLTGFKFTFGDDFASLGALTVNSNTTKEGNLDATYVMDGLEFFLPTLGDKEFFETLKKMGYQKISVSGNLNVKYQQDTSALSASLNDLTFKDMGKINATLQVNIPSYIPYDSPETILKNPDAKFKEFSMVLQNNGIVEKLLNSASQEQGVTKAEIKKTIVESFKEAIQEEKDIPSALAEDTVKALNEFLQNPQKTEIKLSSTPAAPVSDVDLDNKSTSEVFDLLNVKIQAVPLQ